MRNHPPLRILLRGRTWVLTALRAPALGVFGTRFTLSFLGLSVLAACSSPPDFKPSKPVEEASTFSEALGICCEYSLVSQASEKPVTHAELVPWMRCFETTIQRFQQARENESFVLFFHELSRFDGKPDARREPVARSSMNLAVGSALSSVREAVRGRRRVFSTDEKRAIRETFPGYLDYLASVGTP